MNLEGLIAQLVSPFLPEHTPEIVFEDIPKPAGVWDEWFHLVGLDKEWQVVKETCQESEWESWSHILEMNRLNFNQEKKSS